MIEVTTNAQAIKRLAEVLENNTKMLRKDIRIALSKTANHVESQWAKEISETIPVTRAVIKKLLRQEVANIDAPELKASVSLFKSKRLSLKEYRAKQTRSGVSYTGYKGAKRKTLPGAFMGPKPGTIALRLGGHVFTRQGQKQVMSKGRYAGKMRQPIVKRFGPSPFDTTQKHEIPVKLVQLGKARLLLELNKRVRFRSLKASGAI